MDFSLPGNPTPPPPFPTGYYLFEASAPGESYDSTIGQVSQ
jgi:hypothetical protein